MKTNDFNQAMITIHGRVKDIMTNIGLKIHEKEIPTVLRAPANEWEWNCLALYVKDTNTIYFKSDEQNPIDNNVLEMLIAHEMTHSCQDLTNFNIQMVDATVDEYWEQQHEVEAYAVQDIYFGLFLSGPIVAMQTKANINHYKQSNSLKDMFEVVKTHYKNSIMAS